jgi:pimeloyl-ACP methyl ester carboxylesterase
MQKELRMRPFRSLRRGVAWTAFTMGGVAAIVTARHILATPQPIETALPGERLTARRPEGDIFYNVGGPAEGRPIVLLHDLYAGASNYEFRHLYPRLAVNYHVYAPDWLGFGLSERPALAYTGEYYAHVLGAFLRETVQAPAVVIAHGLAANLAVRTASDDPALFDRLVLIAPHTDAGAETAPSAGQTLVRLAERSALGLVPYAALATRTVLRWRLRQARGDGGTQGVSDDALDHAYANAHQFGGQYAALAVETGELDLPMHNAFALLEPPVMVVGGSLDVKHPPQSLEDLTLLRPEARLAIVPNADGAVAEDHAGALTEIVARWLVTPEQRHPPFPLLTPEGEAAPAAPEISAPEAGATTRKHARSRRGTPPAGEPASDSAPADSAAPDGDVRVMLEPENDAPVPPAVDSAPHLAGEREEPHDTSEV